MLASPAPAVWHAPQTQQHVAAQQHVGEFIAPISLRFAEMRWAIALVAMLATSDAWQIPIRVTLRTTPSICERARNAPAAHTHVAVGLCQGEPRRIPMQPVMAASPEVQAAFLLVALLSVTHGLLPSPAPRTTSDRGRVRPKKR